jgi:hypothetical protein
LTEPFVKDFLNIRVFFCFSILAALDGTYVTMSSVPQMANAAPKITTILTVPFHGSKISPIYIRERGGYTRKRWARVTTDAAQHNDRQTNAE